MSEAERLLTLLADVHEPPVPQAQLPWWWMLNALLGVAWIGLWAWRRHRRRTAWRREAIAALDALPAGDAATRLSGMATVLRRVMRGRLGESVGTLDGDVWLDVLDRRFDTHWFTHGDGRIFGLDLYQRDAVASIDVDALHADLRSLLRALSARRSIELPVNPGP